MRAAIFSVTIKALDVFVALEFRHRNYVDYVAHTHMDGRTRGTGEGDSLFQMVHSDRCCYGL